jgi:spore coat protein A, manganese oxidase
MKRVVFTGLMALLIVAGGLTSGARASFQIPQTPLNPATVPKYAEALPTFVGARVLAGSALAVSYEEFQQKVLPLSFYGSLPPGPFSPYPGITIPNLQDGTLVWGYKVGGAPHLYPGFTVEAQKGTATAVTYTNLLGTAAAPPILQRFITVDQTLHWANPMGLLPGSQYRFSPYSGPQPVVPHLHGGELRSDSDGGPDEWWTPGGEGYLSTPKAPGGIRGPSYFKNVYTYPNTQEAATLWFHDHVLGVTRTNVYAGLAAFWFIRDNYDTGKVNTTSANLENPSNLPAGDQEVEVVFQDRQFDTHGQWLFPDGYPGGLNGPPPNPDVHPYWNPEFFGDVIVVNGKSWPFFQVQPRRYRLRLLDGSNARFYQMHLEDAAGPPGTLGPPIYVIGTDGGLLDAPVKTSFSPVPPLAPLPADWLIMAPGERYDVIIDFTGMAGKTFTILNDANGPFPGGTPPDPAGTAQLMQFQVSLPLVGTDSTFDPAAPMATLRGGPGQPQAIVRLANGAGDIGAGVVVNKKRQLVLREVSGPGGPLEVLVNNTKWDGLQAGTVIPVPGSSRVGANWATELPQIGSTEEWEIINLTVDAHPIHLHMIQFQIMNRQPYNTISPGGYPDVYTAAFGSTPIDGYGPPYNYNVENGDLALGGNPAITPYLTAGPFTPPLPHEQGWKDVVVSYPGEVTRIIARWAPQNVAVNGVTPGQNLFAFDPTYGPGYVWHCHIIDHEDNEMMRPYIPTKRADNILARIGGEIPGIIGPLLLFP